MQPSEILRRVRELRVAVVGDPILDRFLEGRPIRLCREAPVPVVRREGEIERPGGAANVALNVAALGARAELFGVVGEDEPGARLVQLLAEAGVGLDGLVRDPGLRTQQKLRVMADGSLLVRIDDGSAPEDQAPAVEHLIQELRRKTQEADLVLISDYGLGTCGAAVRAELGRLGGHAQLLLDGHHLDTYEGLGATAVLPSLDEAAEVGGVDADPDDEASLAKLAKSVGRRIRASLVVITLGKQGAVLLDRDDRLSRVLPPGGGRAVADVGAGDTLVAAFGLALTAGAPPVQALEVAQRAAMIVVGKAHTAAVSAGELAVALRTEPPRAEVVGSEEHRRRSLAEIDLARRQGRRIVFTNGVFDVLHPGHVTFLRQARELGDVLVVGVNDDEAVRQLKGPGRPILPAPERAGLLLALDGVDHAIVFSELTASGVLRQVRPDVYVKGGDYTDEDLPERDAAAEVGAEVRILPRRPGLSTTEMVRRAQRIPHPLGQQVT